MLESPTRTPLTREQVLRAALAYVDELGLDALSMHKLGARLGVKAMSLYNHAEGKDDLLHLDALCRAGFSPRRAIDVVRTVLAYAFGYALSELCWSCAGGATGTELARLRQVSRRLPTDVPDDRLQVAMDLCTECDLAGALELGLDLMLQGVSVS
jgi:AcrR family transcriptional regulator